MRVAIFLDIDDAWLDARVAEFNASAPAHDSAEVHRDAYVENVVRDLVVDDSLPLTLFGWDMKVSLVMDPPALMLPLRSEQEAAFLRALLRRHIRRDEEMGLAPGDMSVRLLKRLEDADG